MTYKIGSIGEFARWTKQVVADPNAARDVPKRWFDSEATAARADGRKAAPEALAQLLSEDDQRDEHHDPHP